MQRIFHDGVASNTSDINAKSKKPWVLQESTISLNDLNVPSDLIENFDLKRVQHCDLMRPATGRDFKRDSMFKSDFLTRPYSYRIAAYDAQGKLLLNGQVDEFYIGKNRHGSPFLAVVGMKTGSDRFINFLPSVVSLKIQEIQLPKPNPAMLDRSEAKKKAAEAKFNRDQNEYLNRVESGTQARI